jgi:hypothetical protein
LKSKKKYDFLKGHRMQAAKEKKIEGFQAARTSKLGFMQLFESKIPPSNFHFAP